MSRNGVEYADCEATYYPSIIREDFGKISPHRFMLNGKPFHCNGFNAYWLMCMASDPTTKTKVTDAFQQASKIGMNIIRTWAFSDGGNKPLQTSPGIYNENTFKGLDFVISEAKKCGLRLILCLVNNWDDFGGKKQYVEWARDEGQYLSGDDDFYSNVVIKGYYKNHVKEWIIEMAAEIKSIDKNHLLTTGCEGFWGESVPDRKQLRNSSYEVGTDFISNHQVKDVDFATIHLYPDQWVSGDDDARAKFVEKWIKAHIDDCDSILRKPLLIEEFGKSSWSSGYTVKARDEYFGNIFNWAYESAQTGGSCSGTTFWQVMAEGMENWGDGYQVVLEESPTTAALIAQQSQKIDSLSSSMKI
ncbi:putative mannan endo-1,4-beta-mannosidase 9 [Tanacetum coccineum]